jgi:integrase
MVSQMRSKGTGTLVPRGEGRWLIRADFGRDPVTGRRDRRNETFVGTKTAAQERLNEILRERDAGVLLARESITLAKWLPDWLARHYAEGRISLRTRERYGAIIERHFLPALGALELKDLRPHHVDSLKGKWLTGTPGAANRPLAPATVHKHLVVRASYREGRNPTWSQLGRNC